MKKINNKKGFTLIELLMVVSIIGILSSIVVAVLVDARVGAKNNRKNELVRQYVTALGIYFGEYGKYPEGGCTVGTEDGGNCSSISYVCLGDDYPNNACKVIGDHNEDAGVNSQISEFAPSAPSSLDISTYNNNNFVGIAYGCTDINTCTNYKISWVLEGEGSDAECFGGSTELDLGPISICTYSTNSQ